MENLEDLFFKAKAFSVEIIAEYSEKIVYHDIKFATRMQKRIDKIVEGAGISNEDKYIAKIACWLSCASYTNQKFITNENDILLSNFVDVYKELTQQFIKDNKVETATAEYLTTVSLNTFYPNVPETIPGKLMVDCRVIDFIEDPEKRMRKAYKEIILHDLTISRTKFIDYTIEIAKRLNVILPYCKEQYQTKIDNVVIDLEKEKKRRNRSTDVALKRELDISDAELKKLKSSFAKGKGRDDRGIQTVFRTTLKNHYTLNEMVDKKANIMITVNSIIISVMLGGYFGITIPTDFSVNYIMQRIPMFIFLIASIFSIIYAILSIRPGTTHGKFTEDEIRNKGGNLLYYGNFHSMHKDDFEWAFLQMMNDQEYLYSTMIKDLYYLGQILERKFRQIRLSLTIFMFGIIIASVAFVVTQCIS